MPRTKGDHEARRRDVSEAVWRVLATHGFSGLTLRAVARELGATTGLLTHYFPTKNDLVAHALDLLEHRSAARPRRAARRGLPAVRAALLDILPLTAEDTAGNRIRVSSWDTALADAALSDDYGRKYARSREKLRDLVADAQQSGELPAGDPGRIAAGAQSFVLGLVVQALFDPVAFTPDRQTQLLDDYLSALASRPPAATAPTATATGSPATGPPASSGS
ncbi:TetR/AcrR family transcriptional regulator [Streptomyces sp. NPDC048389]|uniref:TetR/AcrR family transcriptional regulator n=1 Tax=Streptomyces sp. NPDC048389 TaxID=3154622 RepID=UPI003456DA2A